MNPSPPNPGALGNKEKKGVHLFGDQGGSKKTVSRGKGKGGLCLWIELDENRDGREKGTHIKYYLKTMGI